MSRWPAVVLLTASTAVGFSACSSDGSSGAPAPTAPSTGSPPVDIDVEYIESEVEKQIDRRLKVTGTSLDCPTPTSWQVGDSFQCNEDTPGFPPGIANVTKVRDDGRYSWSITNTCEGQAKIVPTPRAGCVTPSPEYTDMTEEWQ